MKVCSCRACKPAASRVVAFVCLVIPLFHLGGGCMRAGFDEGPRPPGVDLALAVDGLRDMRDEAAPPVLTSLVPSHGTLSPAFTPVTRSYSVDVPLWVDTITLTPIASGGAAITVNGQPVISGSPSQPITLVLGHNSVSVIVSAGGATTTYAVDVRRGRGVIDYLKASNTGKEDQFGGAVSLSGDTLAVGAPFEDSSATGVDGDETDNSIGSAGAVYVFTRAGGVWTQQAYIKPSNNTSARWFGMRLSLSGDTLAVGAPFEDSSATGVGGDQANNAAVDSGAVYVFTRTGGAWSQQAYVKAANTGADDQFGIGVSVSGDTLAVGAWNEDSNATGVNGDPNSNAALDSGAAFVFARSGTVWHQQAYLKASNAEPFDVFGYSVALSGDTLAVGAYGEDSNATDAGGDQGNNTASGAGAVYVFGRTGNTWGQGTYLKAFNAGASDRFGSALSLYGDVLVVGARREDSAATGVNDQGADDTSHDSGAAYVFTRSGTKWSQPAYLKASNTDADDRLGVSVSVSGDAVAVGAWQEAGGDSGVTGDPSDNTAQYAGAAYVFR